MNEVPDVQPLLDPSNPDHFVGQRHGFFTIEQIQEVQHIVTDMTQQQVKRVIVLTSNFIITIVALLSTAFGLVAALAWNRAISDWLPTVTPFDIQDKLVKEFVYAVAITFVGIVGLGFLGFLTSRVKGENILRKDR